jgi:hypothetical protein
MTSIRKIKRKQNVRPMLTFMVAGPLYHLLAGMTTAEREAYVARALNKYVRSQ